MVFCKIRQNTISGEHSFSKETTMLKNIAKAEMEFLNINLTYDSSFLLHAVHSPFYWRILMLFSRYLD